MRLPHLLGNERLKAALSPRRGDSFGSAALLEGPAGCGKRTAARDIAMGLLCREENAPCLSCPACRRVLAGTHPDLQTLLPEEGKKGVSVEQIRDLRAQSFLRPSEGVTKVFVIPEADKLNPQSQNALLKVLEEPEETIFLLLCENRGLLLPTVRSRCRFFAVEPLPEPEAAAALTKRGLAPARARELAAAAGGSLGRALALAEGAEDKPREAAQHFLGALEQDELALFAACLELGKLGRDDYAAFCDESCRLLAEKCRATGDRRTVRIFDYLEKQQAMLTQNPSVSALAGALAAYCAAP